MSTHRRLCLDKMPLLLTPDESIHQCRCAHEAEPHDMRIGYLEHRCECGATWYSTDEPKPRPAPDLSWITFVKPTPLWRRCVGAVAVIVGIPLFALAIAVALYHLAMP